MNDIAGECELDGYDTSRYDGWTLDEVIAGLRGSTLNLLKRGSLEALRARREWGGLLVAAAKLVTSREEQTNLFRRVLDIDYSNSRLHMKLWVFWPRVAQMLFYRAESCRRRGVPFVVPGYARCLRLAGITSQIGPVIPCDPPPPPVEPEPLTEVEALIERVAELEQQNRLEREKSLRLGVELDETRDELAGLKHEVKPTKSLYHAVTGWIGARIPRLSPQPPPEPTPTVEVRIGDCRDLIEPEENIYDAIVTDPPYAISLHGYSWDTDIAFSPELWHRFFRVLKPGGFIALFAAPRLYHRAAIACETAGFELYPFMGWQFREGLPKPVNLAELFDRDNLDEREVIGIRRGSGFTVANVAHGAQNRTHTIFAQHARHVSPEAQDWRGYYGVNTLKPCLEPILLAQKPISTNRVIDNVRTWGTGALNIGALQDRYGTWPGTLFTRPKTKWKDHRSDHPSVKPVQLMEDICTLVCPGGGRILDPFAGTGTTGVAAKQRGFDCVLIEQDSGMQPVINDRLRST